MMTKCAKKFWKFVQSCVRWWYLGDLEDTVCCLRGPLSYKTKMLFVQGRKYIYIDLKKKKHSGKAFPGRGVVKGG